MVWLPPWSTSAREPAASPLWPGGRRIPRFTASTDPWHLVGFAEVVLADGEVPAAAEDAREGAMDVDEEDDDDAGALRVMPREPLTMEASPDMLTGEQS